MIKVIETNLSVVLDEGNTIIKDHQSRVIEVDSWKEYVLEIMNEESVSRKCILGSLHGNTLPNNAIVDNLVYDDNHLSCDVYNRFGIMSKKLGYRVR